jgi:uncharacterized alkaline shock family protein YloU/adenylate kinase family enzyme
LEEDIMRIVALVGPSGTGKSHRAIMLAKKLGIEYIIDDGLFIKGTKVIAGKSAKREDTIVSAVKRAVFTDYDHRLEIRKAIKAVNPDSILILGTSERMIEKICSVLGLPDITERVYIEDISTSEDINMAKKQRTKEGKHVIPVPTFEIKKDFSGYFIDTLRIIMRKEDNGEQIFEKTVVRPTFSYLGKYTIADSVIKTLAGYIATKIQGVIKAYNVYVKSIEQGIIISLDVEIIYGNPIIPIVKKLQEQIIKEVEQMTSLHILAVNVNVKKVTKM